MKNIIKLEHYYSPEELETHIAEFVDYVEDGQDNAVSNIWGYKIYELQEFLTITNYAIGPDPFIVNLHWYDKLPEDLKKIFDEVAVETMKYSDQLNREKELNTSGCFLKN